MDAPQEKPRPPKAEDPAPRDDVVVTQNRCPFCRDDVRGPTTEWVACAACLARHHEPCWGEGGGKCAACAHPERLRAESPGSRAESPGSVRRRLPTFIAAVVVLVCLVVVGAGVRSLLRVDAQARAAQDLTARARREALARAERAALPQDPDARFAIARRTDELRQQARSGARSAERSARQKAAWQQARLHLPDAINLADPGDAARFEAALKEIDRLDPPPRWDGMRDSIFESQDDYVMPPRREHPEHAAMIDDMARRNTSIGFRAHLLVLTGDPNAALAEANRGLDHDATEWISWLARGEALLALEDTRGAALAFTLSEAFSHSNPTWTLLARVDLAFARADREGELAAARDALEVGSVLEWGGHLEALLLRIATLEHELGERR